MKYTSVRDFIPKSQALEQYWRELSRFGPYGLAYYHRKLPLRVIITLPEPELVKEMNGEEWVHVSVSHEKRIPSYEEMKEVKRVFIGDDRNAYSIWPRKQNHVNIHSRCLHLWHRADKDPIPEFGTEGTI